MWPANTRLIDRYAGPLRPGNRIEWCRIGYGGRSCLADVLLGTEGFSIKPYACYTWWEFRTFHVPWHAVAEVRRFREFPSTYRLFVPDVASSIHVSPRLFEAMGPHLDHAPVVWQTVASFVYGEVSGWLNRKREEFDRRDDAR